MKRYYSHYTFIYPNQFLSNYVVEITDNNRINKLFHFEKETANTEYTSGLQIFLPEELIDIISIKELIGIEPQIIPFVEANSYLIRSFLV